MEQATQIKDTNSPILFEKYMKYVNNHHLKLSKIQNRFFNNLHNHKDIKDNNENDTDGPHDDHLQEQETDIETLHREDIHKEDIHKAAVAQAAPKCLSFCACLVTIPKQIPPALLVRKLNRGRSFSVDIKNENIGYNKVSSNGSSDYKDRYTAYEKSVASPGLSDRRQMDGFDDVVLDGSDDRTKRQYPT